MPVLAVGEGARQGPREPPRRPLAQQRPLPAVGAEQDVAVAVAVLVENGALAHRGQARRQAGLLPDVDCGHRRGDGGRYNVGKG